MNVSEIKEFYKGTKIFVTGATGFVGKTLIEKLLRVTDVDIIYLLIRAKKGKTAEERISILFDNPLFDILKFERPNHQSRIKAVIGECGPTGLIISDSDIEELKANVDIVFHSAATVNFDENLKTAYEINVRGTQGVLDMAKEMHKLKAIVYVSTAYVYCNRDEVIEEKVYDYPFDDIVIKIEKGTKEDLDESETVIGKWPNTYTFTKAIAESLVKKQGQNLPIGIFRPSIIVSTYKEPMPGWLDNIYAINGISIGILMGFLRVLPFKKNAILDAIPVDKCVSALAVIPWDIAEGKKTKKYEDIPIYNYTSGEENPLTILLLDQLNFANGVPSLQAIWYPWTIFVTNDIIFWILSIILEIIPAIFLDASLFVVGKKPRFVSINMKVLNFVIKIKFFGMREWKWDNKNVQNLWRKLNNTDRELFPFSMASLSWTLYSKSYIRGIRKYVLKEDDATIPQAYAKYYRFRVAHYLLTAVVIYTIFFVTHLFFSKMYAVVF